MMKKILFVTYGGGHATIIASIVSYIIENEPNLQPRILALTSAYEPLFQRFGPKITKRLSEFTHLFQNELEEIKRLSKEFGPENFNSNASVSLRDTFDYIGISMWDLISSVGEVEAREAYSTKKRQAFLPVLAMERIIHSIDSAVVVVTTSPRFELASILASRKLRVPSVQIIDLFADLNPMPSADKICVMNQGVKKDLIQRGVDSHSLVITGQPAIEASVNLVTSKNVRKLKRRCAFLSTKKTVLLATQKLVTCHEDLSKHGTTDNRIVYMKLFQALQTVKDQVDCNIIIRIHPSESMVFYKELLNKHDSFTIVNEMLDLAESIAVSDIVLTHSSTVAIEAQVANRQVLTFKHEFDVVYPIRNLTISPFIFASDFDELKDNLLASLHQKIGNQENAFMAFNASKNITQTIKDLIC